ncbi:UPF0149 family protein [Otariodibacter oris]|uniref:Uncharacterized protein n=1 Tax=Otariodibacter oris TaxID=1032623 RepID=A0A420XEZ1_9PAST|nr:UPF0149 family protein [Otariodibacter oris]QGM80172.1 hypothetical protein A6A10_01525 [Otariodibacter oris]RKR70640.1 hypothetical protein DES31_1895 [Otariodibacter oris]
MAILKLNDLKQLISTLQINYSPAEFHGFLSGLVSGGIQDESWKTLTYQFTNDGHAFSQIPLKDLSDFYQQLNDGFDEVDTLFSLWLPEDENGFTLADGIAEWTSHFLLGLGLAQPTIEKEATEEVNEALNDLEEITKLGYDEQDDNQELLEAGEEIIEYLRVITLFLHSHFAKPKMENKPQMH